MFATASGRRVVRWLATMAAGAVALGLAGAPATAATPSGPAAGSVVRHTTLTDRGRQAAAVVAFWTPQRMRAAQPVGQITGGTAATPSAEAQVPTAAAGYVPPALPPSQGLTHAGVYGTVGRVFFADSSGALDSCSGGSVTSEAGDMVLTAGHCVFGGPQFVNDGSQPRAWYYNWVYVPGYFVDSSGNAQAPYGYWPAWGIATTSGWVNSADPTGDIGMALVVRNGSGQALTTVVGGNGLTWDQPTGEMVQAYGYPVNPANPSAPVGVQTCMAPLYRWGGTGPYGDIDCGMGPGASGGPWLVGTDIWGLGYVAGINSQQLTGWNLVLSPWFSQNVLGMYTQLRNS